MTTRPLLPVVLCALALLWLVARADTLLRIEGAVAGDAVTFDHAALAALGPTVLETETPWTEGTRRFEGVLLRTLLAAVGARGESLRAEALNDYAATIPVRELRTVDVLLAWSMDGRRLQRRDKGPFWIVYPWSQRPELDDRVHRQRSVWQVVRLVVE